MTQSQLGAVKWQSPGSADRWMSETEPINGAADELIDFTAGAPKPDNVRRLRATPRLCTSVRALLYRGSYHQSTVICDISRFGAGLDGAYGLLPDDVVTLRLLSGRSIDATVRWWAGGRCGVAFAAALPVDDPLIRAAELSNREAKDQRDGMQVRRTAQPRPDMVDVSDRVGDGETVLAPLRVQIARRIRGLCEFVLDHDQKQNAERDAALARRVLREEGAFGLVDWPKQP